MQKPDLSVDCFLRILVAKIAKCMNLGSHAQPMRKSIRAGGDLDEHILTLIFSSDCRVCPHHVKLMADRGVCCVACAGVLPYPASASKLRSHSQRYLIRSGGNKMSWATGKISATVHSAPAFANGGGGQVRACSGKSGAHVPVSCARYLRDRAIRYRRSHAHTARVTAAGSNSIYQDTSVGRVHNFIHGCSK